MFYFETRKKARTFAQKQEHYKVVDNGTTVKKRWSVKVL